MSSLAVSSIAAGLPRVWRLHRSTVYRPEAEGQTRPSPEPAQYRV